MQVEPKLVLECGNCGKKTTSFFVLGLGGQSLYNALVHRAWKHKIEGSYTPVL